MFHFGLAAIASLRDVPAFPPQGPLGDLVKGHAVNVQLEKKVERNLTILSVELRTVVARQRRVFT